MSDQHPPGGREIVRPWEALADSGVASAYAAMFLAVRPLVVGRRMTVRVDGDALALTVTRFGLRSPSGSRWALRRLVTGRHNDVVLEARDVVWGGHEVRRVNAVLHGLHVRGGLRPTELVAATVEVVVEVPAPTLDGLFRWAAPRLAGDVDEDGVARLHFAKRRGSGHVEVDARVEGTTLLVTPRAVVRRGRRWPLPARTPSYRVRIPELPHGLRLTSVEFAPGLVRLNGCVVDWRLDVSRTRPEDVIGRLGVVARPLRLLWPSLSSGQAVDTSR